MNSYGFMALILWLLPFISVIIIAQLINLSYDIKKLKKLLDRVEGDK